MLKKNTFSNVDVSMYNPEVYLLHVDLFLCVAMLAHGDNSPDDVS